MIRIVFNSIDCVYKQSLIVSCVSYESNPRFNSVTVRRLSIPVHNRCLSRLVPSSRVRTGPMVRRFFKCLLTTNIYRLCSIVPSGKYHIELRYVSIARNIYGIKFLFPAR